MFASIGKQSSGEEVLEDPRKTLLAARSQKCNMCVMALLKTKPSKPDTKKAKADALKQELKDVRKHGLKDEDILVKSVLDAALKAISNCS